jgi:transposase-like protein
MVNKRKQYSAQFKAKIAIEAISAEKTVPELASQYELHPTGINNWKRQHKSVEIYRPQKEVEILDAPQSLSGEEVLPGFVLNLQEFW